MKEYIFWIVVTILMVIVILACFVLFPIKPEVKETSKLGLTFAPRAASFLGLDWKETYQAMLKDLNPDILRIPVYWNVLEPENAKYNWSDFDYQMDQLVGTDTQVMLAVGYKLPRWPECHIPDWANNLDDNARDEAMVKMITDVVNRYKDHPNLYAWQVNNEAFFPFGECPEWTTKNIRKRVKSQIELVKSLDPNHKVTTSDSGELSTWLRTSTLPIDALDISLYRVAYNGDRESHFYWPVNPYFYKIHSMLISFFVKEIIISELQMEPWGPTSVDKLTEEEINLSFSPYNFDERIDFAKRTGATTILGWGVEWWYYMKEIRGVDDYWQKAIKYYAE